MAKNLTAKKAAFIIPFKDFRDVEYFIPAGILRAAGIKITTVSVQKGIALGADGGEAKVDLEVSELKTEDFDALVFAGGPGAAKLINNEDFHTAACNFFAHGKIVAAICIAPAILAEAGILEGKKAAVWSAPLNKEAIKILEKNGANYEDKSVVVDGNIITANGPMAAKEFAEVLVDILDKK